MESKIKQFTLTSTFYTSTALSATANLLSNNFDDIS